MQLNYCTFISSKRILGINIFLLYVVKPTMMNTGKKAAYKKQGKKGNGSAMKTQNIDYGICICRVCCRDGDYRIIMHAYSL